MTQTEAILKYLRQKGDWIPSYSLCKTELLGKWIGTDGIRLCRDLEIKGLIEKKREGKYMTYKAKPPKETIDYYVQGQLISKKVIW